MKKFRILSRSSCSSSCTVVVAVLLAVVIAATETVSDKSVTKHSCPVGWMSCGDNERCLAGFWVCDGDDDCGNMMDEIGCENTDRKLCDQYQFSCKDNGRCIPLTWVCDGHADCTDISDELQCDSQNVSSCDGFRCKNNICIPQKWRCDSQWDCEDGSDEEACKNRKLICASHEYKCGDNGPCVSLDKVCDNKKNCPKGEDEGSFCADIACKNKSCSHHCYMTPSGAKCSCNDGYELHSDGKSCIDVDECSKKDHGPCTQRCTNVKGSYSCSCLKGYTLVNKSSCVADGPEPLMIYATTHEIRGLWLRTERFFPIAVISKNQVYGLSYDLIQSRVYWIEVSSKGGFVLSAELDGSDKTVVLSKGLQVPEDIAVDHIARNLYITDLGLKQILVCKIDGSVCHAVIKTNIDKPRAIVLDPKNGYMYWTDWGNSPGVYRAEMSGYGRVTLVSTNLIWPNGLTLDFTSNRIYWCDSELKSIEYISMDGKERQVVIEDPVFHPYSLALFEDTLYWSDWTQYSVDSCNKRTGRNQSLLVRGVNKQVMGIHIYHPVLYPSRQNPCWDGTCSHMCLLSVQGYVCACPHGYELARDASTCMPEPTAPFLLAAEDDVIFHIHPEAVGEDIVTEIPSRQLVSVGDMAYDWHMRVLYISDVSKHVIYTMNTTSRRLQVFVSTQLDAPEGLDFDWIGSNLYWVDAAIGHVEVVSKDSKYRRILVSKLTRPMDLVLSPDKGVMFIATTGLSPSIKICDMDGSGCKTLVASNLGIPVALAVSDWQGRVFWADARSGSIESTNMKGELRRKNLQRIGHVMSIAINENYTFWTDMDRHLVHYSRNDKALGVQGSINLPHPHNGSAIIKIAYFMAPPLPRRSVCSIENGGCSELCLVNPLGYVCSCSTGKRIADDTRTCEVEPLTGKCASNEFACADGNCIKLLFKCDNRNDCSDGSDELLCDSACPLGDFRCDNGRCIIGSWRCDHMDDCTDNSDETNCTKGEVTCASSDFNCGVDGGKCVPVIWKCDGDNDCGNNADEAGCQNRTCGSREMRCEDGRCIPMSWKCDGDKDCRDNSDESSCSHVSTCKTDDFHCKSGGCLDRKLRCDRTRDCEDGSDEEDCSYQYTGCSSGFFKCNDNKCIANVNLCDGYVDCPAGEDEADCKSTSLDCRPFEFPCKSGRCILKDWLCDGYDDCKDFEDEMLPKCHFVPSPTSISVKRCDGFKCVSGQCIPLTSVCNNVPDCLDQSDEGVRCGTACSTDNGGCSQKCRDTPVGPICSCREGYALLGDSVTCEDIDECMTPGHCSQICTNIKGGFKCSCVSMYTITADKRRCKAEGGGAVLLALSKDRITSLSLEGSSQHLVEGTQTDVRAVDYDAVSGSIFWTELANGVIGSLSKDLTYKAISVNLNKPSHLSYDWIGRNFYFFAGSGSIDACKRDSNFCGVVLQLNITINSFITAPTERLMFWSVWSDKYHSTGMIERSNMDGSRRVPIVSNKVNSPSSLTVDSVLQRLFWADSSLDLIESVDLDGLNRKVVISQGVGHPYSIALFEDFIYWSDWGTEKVIRCNKFNGGSRFVLHWNDIKAKQLKVQHPVLQPEGYNSCLKATCEHLCLNRVDGFSCACSYNFVTGPSFNSCIARQQSFVDHVTQDKVMCSANYCMNGGMCSVDSNSRICSCTEPFRGSRCEYRILSAAVEDSDYTWVAGLVLGLLLVVLVLVVVVVLFRRHSKRFQGFSESVSVSFKNPMFSSNKGNMSTVGDGTVMQQSASLEVGKQGTFKDTAASDKTGRIERGELYRWPSSESVDSIDTKDEKGLISRNGSASTDKMKRFFQRI